MINLQDTYKQLDRYIQVLFDRDRVNPESIPLSKDAFDALLKDSVRVEKVGADVSYKGVKLVRKS